LKQLHQEYWRVYRDLQSETAPDLPIGRSEGCYFIYPMGVSGCHMAASILTKKKLVTFYLLLQGEGREERFQCLRREEAKILAELGKTRPWDLSDKSNRARITVELGVTDPYDQSDWPRQHRWILQQARSFDKAFRKRLQDMKGAK
jgi:hypothetical protein